MRRAICVRFCFWCASGSFRVAGWARDVGNWFLRRPVVTQMGRKWK